MKIKDAFKNIENGSYKKNLYNLLIVLLVGVLIILISSFFNPKSSSSSSSATAVNNNVDTNDSNISESETNEALSNYENSQKDQLKNILSSIDGVGNVKIMLTLESSPEKVPAVDVNKSTTNTNEKDNSGGTRNSVQENGGSTVVMTSDHGESNIPMILKVLNPKVNGVVIVAEGGGDKALEYKIIKTVASLYDIPEHKVSVFSMKK